MLWAVKPVMVAGGVHAVVNSTLVDEAAWLSVSSPITWA
jgi:hypothetical protein